MRMIAVAAGLILCVTGAGADEAAGRAPAGRTVMVAPFSVPAEVMAGPDAGGLGGALSAMVTTALVQSGRFVVVTRPDVEAPAPWSSSVVPELPGRGGTDLPAHELVVAGTVTELSQSARESGFSLGFGLGRARHGLAPQSVTGRVALDVRVVEAATGRILLAYTVRESFKARGVSARVERGALSLEQAAARRAPLAEAARRAAESAVRRMVEAMGR
jgi:curli biogenesis system outer membrane secretion channel CsgG